MGGDRPCRENDPLSLVHGPRRAQWKPRLDAHRGLCRSGLPGLIPIELDTVDGVAARLEPPDGRAAGVGRSGANLRELRLARQPAAEDEVGAGHVEMGGESRHGADAHLGGHRLEREPRRRRLGRVLFGDGHPGRQGGREESYRQRERRRPHAPLYETREAAPGLLLLHSPYPHRSPPADGVSAVEPMGSAPIVRRRRNSTRCARILPAVRVVRRPAAATCLPQQAPGHKAPGGWAARRRPATRSRIGGAERPSMRLSAARPRIHTTGGST